MCLCFYHIYTFSNRHAYERLLWRLFNHKHGGERYIKTTPVGWIHVVREFGPFWRKYNWDDLPIEELLKMERVGGFFTVYYYRFNSWQSLRDAIKEIGAAPYLFGEAKMQIH